MLLQGFTVLKNLTLANLGLVSLFISFNFHICNNKSFDVWHITIFSLFKSAIARFCCTQHLLQWKTSKGKCPFTKNYYFVYISLTLVDYFKRRSRNVKNDLVALQPLSLSCKIIMLTKTSKRDFFPPNFPAILG